IAMGVLIRLVSGPLPTVFNQITDAITGWIAGTVGALLQGVDDTMGQSATPQVTAVWFSGSGSPYVTVRQIAALLMVGVVLAAIIHGLVIGDLAGLVRPVMVGVPLAVLATVATTTVVDQLVRVTDVLSSTVLSSQTGAATRFLSEFGHVTATAQGPAVIPI